MQDQLSYEHHSEGVKVGILKGSNETDLLKSHNHNLGVTLKKRQFIPLPDQDFKQDILKKIDAILSEMGADNGVQDTEESSD